MLSVGGEVKIILPELERKGTCTLKGLIEEYGAKVKFNPLLHGQSWGVIIGLGDITSTCLGGKRFDAAIWSNHPDITKSVIDSFNRVWEDEGTKEPSGSTLESHMTTES